MPEQILSTGIDILANDIAVVAGENVSVTVAEVGGVTQYTVNADVPSVDTELSLYSPNPVANSAVTAALQGGGGSTINIGDLMMGMPGDPDLWDKIAEPMFNGEFPKIIATFAGEATVDISAANSNFSLMLQHSQASTFAEFKEFLETNNLTSYATFTLSGVVDGATFSGYAMYTSGLQPFQMVGSPYNQKIQLRTDNNGATYLDPNIMLIYYVFDSEYNSWIYNQVEWVQSGASITDPGSILYNNLKTVTGFFYGDIGNLTTATATNTIYTTDDINDGYESLPCKIGIKEETSIGDGVTQVVYTLAVRVTGLARECDSQGFPISGQPETPIMWLGQFEWQEKNGIYAYRCVSEQMSVLATV